MRPTRLLALVVSILALGLVAAGCGGEDVPDVSVPGISEEDIQNATDDAQQALEGLSDEEIQQATEEAEQALQDAQDQADQALGDAQDAAGVAAEQCNQEGLPQSAVELCEAAAEAAGGGG